MSVSLSARSDERPKAGDMPVEAEHRGDPVAMNGLATVSVIIPPYNSGVTIGQTLAYLQGQTPAEQILEVIVVDSSDDKIPIVFLRDIQMAR